MTYMNGIMCGHIILKNSLPHQLIANDILILESELRTLNDY